MYWALRWRIKLLGLKHFFYSRKFFKSIFYVTGIVIGLELRILNRQGLCLQNDLHWGQYCSGLTPTILASNLYAVLIQIQLFGNVSGKAAEHGLNAEPLDIQLGIWLELLVSTWWAMLFVAILGHEPTIGKISVCVSLSL